ncbi:diguanylate cyclase [Pseudomonas sp. ABC1]|uniref:diguanylate cyclase n=1 Tax=Pseudomonas sp. ABC1 TaxID=2748080 RepID=UPI0015C327D7|nr:diguanylate cyclase [Pseudomonas sp. ABC1]QLF93833.1 diguanylate cyclase [Pseudomonas sp. ABC1]
MPALRSFSSRVLLSLLLVLLACLLYWGFLLHSFRVQLNYAEEQTRLRAAQMSDALTSQVSTLMSGLEYLVRSLGTKYQTGEMGYFRLSVSNALDIFPKGSIAQIAVADRQGDIVYSSLGAPDGAKVSIADREHFKVHASGRPAALFISRPLLGRLSGRWTIQLSYPLYRQGEFDGALVVSVSPDYISDYFRLVFTESKDVAILFRDDGSYLARSSFQNRVMNTLAYQMRDFTRDPSMRDGQYRYTSDIDGIERDYAWRRLDAYPLVVSIGLDRERALRDVRAQVDATLWGSLAGTLLVLLTSLGIAVLFVRLREERGLLSESEKRLGLALEGGGMGSWELDFASCDVTLDVRLLRMLGLPTGTEQRSFQVFEELAHPDDLPAVIEAMRLHVAGDSDIFECECRLRHSNGVYLHTAGRAKVIERDEEGKPRRMAGVQLDITQSVTQRNMLSALFDNNAAEIFLASSDRFIRLANQRAVDRFSASGASLNGQNFRVIHGDDASYEAFHTIYGMLRDNGKVQVEYPLRDAQGQKRWFSIQGALLEPGRADGDVIWTMVDVTERREAELALSAVRVRLQAVIEHFPGGVLVEDETGHILLANQVLLDMFGLDVSPEALVGQPGSSLEALLPFDLQSRPSGEADADVALDDGRTLRVVVIPVQHRAGHVGHLRIFHDITERRRWEQDLERMAMTDPLTGLANRNAFMSRMQLALGQPTRGEDVGALLMLDLDHFKRVNDSFGHAAGDQVLVYLARILREVLRASDTVGRLGGEEFAVLLPSTGRAGASMLAERLRNRLEQSAVEVDGARIFVTMSIGIAMFDGDIKHILARADEALYKAKANGRNRVEFASDDDHQA